MAAPTTYSQYRTVRGPVSVARVPFGSGTTADLVAAVTGKTIYVLGILVTNTSSGTTEFLSAANSLLKLLAQTTINLPQTPIGTGRDYVVHLQTNVSEALRMTSPNAAEATVYYVQE